MILMMSAKMATTTLLKIAIFWKKCYGVIIPVDDVTIQIISRDSNYIVTLALSLVTLVFLWERLSQPQFYKYLLRETTFFEKWSQFKFNNLALALGTNLKCYSSVAKGLKLNVRKFWRQVSTFAEVTGEKLLTPPLPPLPILNSVKRIIKYLLIYIYIYFFFFYLQIYVI